MSSYERVERMLFISYMSDQYILASFDAEKKLKKYDILTSFIVQTYVGFQYMPDKNLFLVLIKKPLWTMDY